MLISRPPPPDFEFRYRCHGQEEPPQREGDHRDEYDRDKARVIHSAAFRRLQGKTQVMGTAEADFHRTRLTHSIEVGQIGEGLLLTLRNRHQADEEIMAWLPSPSLMVAACYAHDLGHPPFGHGGEKALHRRMLKSGGFEGNAQTLRILVRLEKYRKHQGGINPTRRMILAVLKYPVEYSAFERQGYKKHPPKCFYNEESDVVRWALEPFSDIERSRFTERNSDDKPVHRTLDASIMECADDIAYAVHDLEDIVARQLVQPRDLERRVDDLFGGASAVGPQGREIKAESFVKDLFEHGSEHRKNLISRLVNLFVTEAYVKVSTGFDHPLLKYRIGLPKDLETFMSALKNLTRDLVIKTASVQQLERRGQMVVKRLFEQLSDDPSSVIPASAWAGLDNGSVTQKRHVCDYIAGMTDAYAERIYNRLFTPGYGSSRDEL